MGGWDRKRGIFEGHPAGYDSVEKEGGVEGKDKYNSYLAGSLAPLLGILSEGLLLGFVPILVEAATDLVGQMLGPDRGEGTETRGGSHIAYHTHHLHGGSLKDGDGLDDFLLVHLGARSVYLAHNMRHARLVRHERRQVRGLGRVILGEGTNLTTVLLRTLLGLFCGRKWT